MLKSPRALKLPIYEVFIILKDVTMTWQKWDSKQALEKRKTSLSLMEVFNIALKCSLQILRTFKCMSVYIQILACVLLADMVIN
jgi:hypothetical protein